MPETGSTVNIRLLIQAVNKATTTVNDLQRQLNEVSQSAVRFAQESSKASGQAVKGMTDLTSGTKEAGGLIDKLAAKFSSLAAGGAKLTALGTAMAAPLIFATTTAAGLERAMSKVKAVTAGAEESFDLLTAKAKLLGRTTEFTAKEAAQGMSFLGQAGLDATEVIEGITPSLTLAVAAGIELAQAADIVTNVVSAMRLPISDLSAAVDILANTTANANTNLVQLADAMTYAGPLASASKIPLEEVAAIIGVLGNNGIQASMAGTALRGMLRSLTSPTDAAQKVLDDLGITIKVSNDGTLDLVDALHQLGDAQLTAAQANKLFGRFAAAGALAVTANTKELDKMIESNYAAQGAAEKMAETMKSNLKGAFIELSSALAGLRASIGSNFLKPLTAMVHAATSAVNAITDLLQIFPVLTKVILYLSSVVIALVAALGAVKLAMASVAATALALQLAMGALGVKSVAAGWKSLAITFGTASTSTLTAASALGVLKGALLLVKTAVLKLWALITAHPIGALITAIGLAIYVIAEWKARTTRLIREKSELINTLSAENRALDKNLEKLEELEKGSNAYVAVTKNMREELIKIAERHDDLEDEAREAAESINELTGEVLDGGEALKRFRKASRDLQLDAHRSRIELLTKEYKRLSGQLDAVNAATYSVGMAFKLMWAIITDGAEGARKVFEEQAKKEKKYLDNIKASGRSILKTLDEFDRIDMDSSRDEMLFFLTEVQGYAEDTARIFIREFEDMRRSSERVARTQKGLASLTYDELVDELDDAVKKVEDLGDAYEDAKRKSENASRVFVNVGGAAAKAAADAAYKQRVEANNARKEGEEDFDKLMGETRKRGIERIEDEYDAEKKKIDRLKDLKDEQYDTEYEYNIAVAELDKKYALKKNEFLNTLLEKAIDSNSKQLSSYTDLAEEINKSNDDVKSAFESVGDEKIKHANEVNETIINAERQAQEIRTDLLSEGPTKFKQQAEAEIKVVKKLAKDKVIEETRLQGLIAAIKEKYRNKQEQYEIELNVASLEREEKLAEQKLEIMEEYLDREFELGRISASEYISEVTGLQIKAIDAQIAILNEKLKEFKDDLDKNPIVVRIKTEIEALETKKGALGITAPSKEAELQMRALTTAYQKQEHLDSLKIQNMDKSLDAMRSRNQAELEMIRKRYDYEYEMAELAQSGKKYLDDLAYQHAVALSEKKKELDRSEMQAKLMYASTMAGEVEGIFADLYEASGKKTKAFLALEKAAAIAQVIWKTQIAITEAMANPGGYAGIALSILMAARGAAALAKIASTGYAKGGEVEGKSPNEKADNIPAWLTAKEWVMPVKSVKKYGRAVMAGLQKGLIPTELFQGFKFPVPIPAYSRGYATGGEVAARNSGAQGSAAGRNVVPPPQPITIMNVTDPTEIDRYLNTSAGQNAVLNILSTRSESVRRIIR